MSGRDGYVVPWPFFYRLGHERSLWEIAERYVQVIRKSDPSLITRPIMGWPPLHKIGVYSGMILAALGYQITEASQLLQHPEQWEDRFRQAEERYPTVAEAVIFFREYRHLRKAERERLITAFGEKLFPIALDRRLQALFGAGQPGINLNDVQRNGIIVLLDWRYVLDTDMKRVQLLWVVSYILEWIKTRGRSQTPFGLILDEFPQMTVKVSAGENPIAADFDTLIHAYIRSSQIWLTIGLQSPLQLDEQLQQTVLSLGTLLVGQAPTMEAARLLADCLYLRDPYWVKHFRPISDPLPRGVIERSPWYQQPKEPQYMPLDQQTEVFAQRIRHLQQYQFFLRPAVDEGTIGTEVYPISIRTIDHGKFPEQRLLQPLRTKLAAKAGRPVADLIREQAARVQQPSVAHAVHYHSIGQATTERLPHKSAGQETPRLPVQRRRVLT
jgi:hypothetical protein